MNIGNHRIINKIINATGKPGGLHIHTIHTYSPPGRHRSFTINTMKKSLILSILSLIILFALPVHAVKKIEANPINIAVMLVQENDSAKMVSTCDYYGYVRQPSQEGYAVLTHKNDEIIRFKVDD